MNASETTSHTGVPLKHGPVSIFLRFLRFGALAWGGPVAQIAMIRHELVDQEHWIPTQRFNRVLAVFQVLPGPEAHELCVYFGMLAGGRVGAFMAGLGFMLPGFVLMLALSWFYVSYGISSVLFSALLLGFQPAVMALIVRAVHRIGGHALTDRWLWLIAIVSAVLHWLGVHFLIVLLLGGITYAVIRGRSLSTSSGMHMFAIVPAFLQGGVMNAVPGGLDLFLSGLKAGLLTFGGAYTAIPFLQHDAVVAGGWMTDAQFLDGLALSGVLPAPLVIFSTFIGYLGNGFTGAVLITAGIFLPSFLFTMVGHTYLERVVDNKSLHAFLDGVTAGVIGLITVVAIDLFPTAVKGVSGYLIFAVALLAAFRWKSRFATPVIVLGAGLVGLLWWLLS